jgi:hypothetical protein
VLLKKLLAKAFNLPTPLGERCRCRGEALAEASLDVAREEVLVRHRGSAARNAERARAAELVLGDNKLHLAELAAGRNERLAHVAEDAARRGNHHGGIDALGRREAEGVGPHRGGQIGGRLCALIRVDERTRISDVDVVLIVRTYSTNRLGYRRHSLYPGIRK